VSKSSASDCIDAKDLNAMKFVQSNNVHILPTKIGFLLSMI